MRLEAVGLEDDAKRSLGKRYSEPEYAPWDGRRVPVTLLGGYLGSGKTTIINELLARATKPMAILVNDVGAVNVDAKLIRSRHSDTIEFTDGCVCCSLSQGLGIAFAQLQEREIPPEHVLLEMSGVANPINVIPWTNTVGFALDGIVVLVDSDQFLEMEAGGVVGHVIRTQVQAADILIPTKLDLVGPEKLEAVKRRLGELAPETPIVLAGTAAASAGLLEIGARHEGIETPDPALFDVHAASVVPLANPIEEAELVSLLDGLDPSVVRAKAIARTPDGRTLSAQVVGSRRTVVELPAAEACEPTDLVLISIIGI